ncbi:hypothetical protein Fcan01_08844 [Folsomia candida]|uniref:Uncharacterized protein n=1 Tax=Folsomia candida TaxID=158441 RepID=A0A226EFK4_FOLCA|nr:hypothetical protein Fcan01_08844 [Folsomia candida]
MISTSNDLLTSLLTFLGHGEGQKVTSGTENEILFAEKLFDSHLLNLQKFVFEEDDLLDLRDMSSSFSDENVDPEDENSQFYASDSDEEFVLDYPEKKPRCEI